MKKLVCALLALCVCFSAALQAADMPTAKAAAVVAEGLQMDARAVILVDNATGQVLYEDNADSPHAIASITKVMTMILVMEAIEEGRITLEDEVTTSEHAYSMGGSQIWLEPGEVMTVDELLRAVAVASANDAAVALAEHVAGSEDTFVAMMNEKAKVLGMTNTTFKNANGLDEAGHISCARDVAIMSREVLRHELVRSYITIWTDELRGGETQLTNTNKLLRQYNGITGIKTGTTNNAGVCISAAAQREGMELIAVVLGSSDSKGRFNAARTLLDYGFANYEVANIPFDVNTLAPLRVSLGQQEYIGCVCDVPETIVVRKGLADEVRCEVTVAGELSAPVDAGAVVGRVCIFGGEETLATYNVCAAQTVEKMDFASGLRLLLSAAAQLA